MVAVRNTRGFGDDLIRLASALDSVDLRGAEAFGQDTSVVRDRLAATVRNYLVPRVEHPDAPFLVVVVGPTGSGKSTLINSLTGLDLAVTGPIRPTTSAPLVLTGDSSSPDSTKVGGVECRVEVGRAPIFSYMSLVDTPDFDSTAPGHRQMAEAMVDNADVVVFVTSALRYADHVPWEILRRARSRGAVVIPVLNRVGPDGGAAVHDFGRRLGDAGFGDDPVRIPEHHIGDNAMSVPSLAVRELRRRLYSVARDRARHQHEVVNRVLNSTANQIRALTGRVAELGAQLDAVEASIASGILTGAVVPRRNRSWAEFPLPPAPEGRRKLRRWKRQSEPGEVELAMWARQLGARLVAELHSRLLESIRASAGSVGKLAPRSVESVVTDARSMLESAVEGWLERVEAGTRSLPHPRLATAITVSATLTPTAQADVVLGDESHQVGESRTILQDRVDVVFEHFAGRLSELWRLEVGDPAVDELEARLVEVMSAYQFANA